MSSQLPEIAQALLNPEIYPDRTTRVKVMQTQMSFIFLTGQYVYKVKKAVDLGYLDYTTLEKRRFFCEQEVALNRRLCPEAYLGVIPITRNKSGIALAGAGEVVEYAVKMLYLPQDRMMNVLLDRNEVSPEMVGMVAQRLADFHAGAAASPDIGAFGKIEAIRINTEENFQQTEKYTGRSITARQYQRIKEFTNDIMREKAEIFNQRVTDNRIRDCHGDLHAQHVCFADRIYIYDCIEFNDRFRYCDVASEAAFLAMDLDHYGRADLSRSFTTAYMNISRDKQVPELLNFYKCYRAYVRGKVGCFKTDDPYISEEERKQSLEDTRSYFELAESYARSRPILFITVGLVGSGKSTLAQAIAKRLGLTVISSDIVRKQLAGIPAGEHRFEEPETGIYSAEFSRKTYAKLFAEARQILRQGGPVILDAAFIKTAERRKAEQLAQETQADFFVIECTLDEANTRERLSQRLKSGAVSDGRWEIYGPQKKRFEPVSGLPPGRHGVIDSARPLGEQIKRIIDNL
jgi:aminoglycoside phosphotransferase family enzyme/predicted kinase